MGRRRASTTGSDRLGESIVRGGDGRLDALQPTLTEIWVDLSRAEPATGAALARTEPLLELDAIAPEFEHLARRLVDDSSHPTSHLHLLAAQGRHLRVEMKAPVCAPGGQCRLDIFSHLDSD